MGSNLEHINLYNEFQVSPQGEFLDLKIDSLSKRPGHGDEWLWDSGFEVKSCLDRKNKMWYAEMRIPIKAFFEESPEAGDEMRVNVYRLGGPEAKRDFFLAWRPTGVWNPHRPQKFGILRLVATQ